MNIHKIQLQIPDGMTLETFQCIVEKALATSNDMIGYGSVHGTTVSKLNLFTFKERLYGDSLLFELKIKETENE